jgi:hypothetical protein
VTAPPITSLLVVALFGATAVACTTKNGPADGSGGSSSSSTPTTSCERNIKDPSLCTCSTFPENTSVTSGWQCVSTCDQGASATTHCCVQPDQSSNAAIAFCSCGAVACASNEKSVTDCRSGSADEATTEGMSTPTFGACSGGAP